MVEHRPLHGFVVLIGKILDPAEDAAGGLISQTVGISQEIDELLLLLVLAFPIDLDEGHLQPLGHWW